MPGRALVTGAAGFIGPALVRRLKRDGVFVRALARSKVDLPADEVVLADLPDQLPAHALAGIDVVYHLAAKTDDTRGAAGAAAEYTRINVDGTRVLVDAAIRERTPRFVFVSSVKAIDEGGPEMRDESTPPSPATAYGRTKLAAERLVMERASPAGVAPVCLRFPVVYGPGQRGHFARLIRAIDRGWFPPPPENHNRRSMLHLENAVDGLMLAGRHEAAPGQTYIVTDAQPYSTRQIYDWIRAALGRKAIRRGVPVWCFRALALIDSSAAQKLLGSAWYSSTKITRELGYRPAHELRDAIREIVRVSV